VRGQERHRCALCAQRIGGADGGCRFTYDALPPNEQSALPSDTRVASALEAPVEVDGRQITLAGYLENMDADPLTDPGHANH
jgi:hypothetical protein